MGLFDAVASLGSAGLQFASARAQNQTSRDIATQSMNFSAQQAQKEMEFQERMSGSAHQREVTDLRAAGLNPLLSLNNGASTPGGAMGSGAQAPVVPELGAIATGAESALRMFNDFQNSNAQRDVAAAQALKARADAKLAGANTKMTELKGPEYEMRGRVSQFINGLLIKAGEAASASKTHDWTFDWDKDVENQQSRDNYGGIRLNEQSMNAPSFSE